MPIRDKIPHNSSKIRCRNVCYTCCRISIGVIDACSEQKQCLYCTNYRVAVGVVDANSEQKQRLHCANYRVSVDPLVGQGWER